MTVNKNFTVKNGLEVNTDLILADASLKKVGIGSLVPQFKLDVAGGIGATDVYVSGIATVINKLTVGANGLTLTAESNKVGVGTNSAQYLLDVRSPVSTGQTALYVYGDVRVTGDIDVDDINLDTASISSLYVSGISSFVGFATFGNGFQVVSGVSTLGVTSVTNLTAQTLNVSGVSTFAGITTHTASIFGTQASFIGIITANTFSGQVNAGVGTVTTLSGTTATYGTGNFTTGNIVTGVVTTLTSTNATLTNINSSGISTLGVTTVTNLTAQQLNVSGVSTTNSLNIGATQVISSARQLQNITSLDATTTSTIESAIANAPNDFNSLNVSGISTLQSTTIIGGGTSTGTTATVLQVAGINSSVYIGGSVGIGTTTPTSKLDVVGNAKVSGVLTATQGIQGIGIQSGGVNVATGVITAINFVGSGVTITGVYNSSVGIATLTFIGAAGGGGGTPGGSSGQVQYNSSNTFAGSPNFTFDGTSVVVGSAVTLNSSGINAAGIVTSNGVNVTTGNDYKVAGNSVLTSTTLGSGVVNSSLTSVGTLGQLNVSGVVTSGVHNVTTGNDYRINNTSVLTSTTLGSGVVNSSLTSVGTLGQINVSGASTLGITTVTNLTAQQLNVSGVVTSGVHNVTTGNDYRINNTSVLTSTTLGSGVVNSSLTSVGTLGQINVSGASTLGITTVTNLTAQQLNVSGVSTFAGITTVTGTTLFAKQLNVSGVVTASSFSGSAQVGVATGGVYLGLTTQFNFVGSGITITPTYSATSGITTLTFTASAGGGGGTSTVSDGVVFNTGITSIASARLTGIGTTVLTMPSTAGKEYIVYSINAANVAAGSTEVNVIGAFDFVSAGNTDRSYFAYNIPIPTGTSIELLKQPQVLNPSDRITMRGTDAGRAGSDNAVEVYISYQEKTSTAYFGLGYGVGIGTTNRAIGIYTSTSTGSVIQSIRLANKTDTGGYPISVTVTSGVNTTYLVDDLIVPKYASVELLDTPKAIKTNDVISVIVRQIDSIDVQISGIKVG